MRSVGVFHLLVAPLINTTPALSQVQGKPIIASGVCSPESGVSIDDAPGGKFGCDSAIIVRTQRGSVLIQFTDKRGDDGRILGFAGTIEGRQRFGADANQIMAVERIYLAAGADAIPAILGTCFMNWTGLQRTGVRLTSLVCAGRATASGSDIKAMTVLEVSSPSG